jgi:hypothetical protein
MHLADASSWCALTNMHAIKPIALPVPAGPGPLAGQTRRRPQIAMDLRLQAKWLGTTFPSGVAGNLKPHGRLARVRGLACHLVVHSLATELKPHGRLARVRGLACRLLVHSLATETSLTQS